MQIEITTTVQTLFHIENHLGVASRAIDMARCVGVDIFAGETCETEIKIVIFDRPGDGFVGYTSPWRGYFDRGTEFIKRGGDRLNDQVVKFITNDLESFVFDGQEVD